MNTQDLSAPHRQSADEQQAVVEAQIELIEQYLDECIDDFEWDTDEVDCGD